MQRRADICVLGLRGFPDVLGGVETHCEQIFSRLSQNAPYRFIVLARRGYIRERRALNDRLEVRPIAALRNKYLEALPNAVIGVLHAWAVVRARVLHVHAIGPGLVAPLAKLLGMKVVVTHHGRDYMRAKWNWLARAVLRFGERAAIRFADRVIVVSPSLAEELKRTYPKAAHRIRFIPNGAERSGDSPPPDQARATLERLGLAPGRYILGVGRLVPEKGFQDLIAAFRAAGVDMKLAIAGASDHRDAFARTLVANGDSHVVFAGRQDRAQLNALYANASLFVLPSSHEGLPIAALEAIAAGAPVLLSDIRANLDLGLPAKHYFPVGDIDALTAMLRIEHDALRIDPAAVLASFDWDQIATQTLRVYQDLFAAPESELAGPQTAGAR